MAKRKFKKLEKGFGSIVYLGEGRRKPYAARLTAAGSATGRNTPKAIGYFETWQKAYDALAEHNRLHNAGADSNLTFTEVYNLLIEQKEKRPQGLSEALKFSFHAAYKRSDLFHNRLFADVRVADYQKLMDSSCGTTSTATLQAIKNLWVQMGKLGEELDLIPKNYAKFVAINQAETDEHSVIFTEEEINKLWQHSDNDVVAALLIMIYSGFRISEYSVINIDLAKMTFSGGLKTQAGKDRVVPIHSRIKSLVERLDSENGIIPSRHKFRRKMRPALELCGIDPKEHTPHDCRATFASRLYAAGVPDLHIKRMLGHSTGDLTKDVYTEVFVDALRQSIEKLQ